MSALFLPLFLLVAWIIVTGGTWWWIRRTPEPIVKIRNDAWTSGFKHGYASGWNDCLDKLDPQ